MSARSSSKPPAATAGSNVNDACPEEAHMTKLVLRSEAVLAVLRVKRTTNIQFAEPVESV